MIGQVRRFATMDHFCPVTNIQWLYHHAKGFPWGIMLYKHFQTIYPGRYEKNSVKEIMVVKIPHCFCVSVMDSLGFEGIWAFYWINSCVVCFLSILNELLFVQNVVQKFQSLPTTSSKLVSHQDPQNYQSSGSLLAPEKAPIKKGNARIPGNDLSDHKPIRVRIKMGSEILSRKVTMVCNDLGLDDSPTSPPRNSHADSSRKLPHTSLEKTSESPSRILRVDQISHSFVIIFFGGLTGSILMPT